MCAWQADAWPQQRTHGHSSNLIGDPRPLHVDVQQGEDATYWMVRMHCYECAWRLWRIGHNPGELTTTIAPAGNALAVWPTFEQPCRCTPIS